MDVQFCGANCVVLSTKQARVVIDDNLVELGAKSVSKEGDIALYTAAHGQPTQTPKLIIDQPGEYEVSGISVYGIAARAHIDQEGQTTATMYKIMSDDLNILVTGHIFPELSDDELETIGTVDLMLVPVGNHGFTMDGTGALKLIKKVEPKLVVPTHYNDPKLAFPVPQEDLEVAIKELAMEPQETVTKLRLKPDELAETTHLLILERV
ncbi:MAG TPA: MBL fold metallo-hydrolase [Candidatus Saccharimonadales bacterium]|nr:MBL fold metallo-hydrolase [Candidatus Saccharimonadales bacterium]